MSYTPTIGLEVHAELATKSKMFCGCKNAPHDQVVNTHICPVCLGHPGTLPVPNKRAIEVVLRFGAAIEATPATYSEFDRKNYFYPDIPKAYQISQYQFPFLTGGEINGVELTRVHLEEDTARSSHELVDGSLVDFNRAGVPLMELVTEPVLHDAASAGAFARELQLLLQTLGISHANMERGEMRIEANVSVSQTDELGTKVEVKNINSFKAVESAIAYEIARQSELLDQGKTIDPETRGWDENASRTFSQRSKETAKDYRYFPDPDIPKLDLTKLPDWEQATLAQTLPPLPSAKRQQYSEFGIAAETIETIISHRELDALMAATATTANEPVIKLAANYISVDLANLSKEGGVVVGDIDPERFVELLELLVANEINSRTAKDLLPQLSSLAGTVREYVEANNLLQQSGEEVLLTLVEQICQANPEQVSEYQAGKETVLKYLVGQGMKLSKGSANPQALEELLVKTLLP